jgi:peptidoglycan/xylan/chitin deacetylase (PgdA/CDA1 family)
MRRVHLPLVLAGTLAAAVASAANAAHGGSRPREYRATRTLNVPARGGGPLALVRIGAGQLGRDLEFSARTAGKWNGAVLARNPNRSICLVVSPTPSAPPSRQVCLRAGARRHKLTLDVETLGAGGRPTSRKPLDAQISRTDSRSFVAQFDPAAARIGGRRYAWRITSVWTGGGCAPSAGNPAPCTDTQPSTPVAGTLVPVHPIGCTRPRQLFVTNGPSNVRAVALTFDDGPSPYTPAVLGDLERAHVNATFFLIGRQIAGNSALVRRELRDGDVVGNHTWSHPNVSGGGSFAVSQLAPTTAAIERASGGFHPCLFRPPYGAASRALEATASSLGLTTIDWNVDPRDWSVPGTDAIVSRVVGAVRPGSIVIMHDGGGFRGETVAAVPRIIATLRRRGYQFDTVPALLGQSVIYGRAR